jgi:hypothetical protein
MMREWKPVTKDETKFVFALFMLMGIVQNLKLSHFSENSTLATPVFGLVISMD